MNLNIGEGNYDFFRKSLNLQGNSISSIGFDNKSLRMFGNDRILDDYSNKLLEDYLKPIKEETVKNSDGTTSILKTYKDGRTQHITNKKDKDGKIYEERVTKRADGTLEAESIKNSDNVEETKFYAEDGKTLRSYSKNVYNNDGKTIKSYDIIDYEASELGTDENPKILYETHKYENGSTVHVWYDDEGTSHAKVETKEGNNSVKIEFDLSENEMEKGQVKLDDEGWPVSSDGKLVKITKKIVNEGLPTEEVHKYEYLDNGSVMETITGENGLGTRFKYYESPESLKNGKSTLDDFSEKFKSDNSTIIKSFHETQYTDENGHLKEGVSPQVALNDDGTLKDGWKIDANGELCYTMPPAKAHMPRIDGLLEDEVIPEQKIIIDGKEYIIPEHRRYEFHDPGFDQTPSDEVVIPEQKIIIDGKEYIIPEHRRYEFRDPGFNKTAGELKEVPTYKVQDGKLVQTGTTLKYVESDTRAV